MQLAKDYGFEVKEYPVPAAQMQNQSSLWLSVRRDRPDYMIMWGWGAMNPTAVQEAAKTGYPMDHFIGVWWSGSEDDARPAGAGGKGYLALNFNAVGANFPAIKDIAEVRDRQGQQPNPGEGQGRRELLQSRRDECRGHRRSHPQCAEDSPARRTSPARKCAAVWKSLQITAARWKEIGSATALRAPISVTCSDHNGHHSAYMQQWDGAKWVKVSDWISPMKDKVMPLIDAAAAGLCDQERRLAEAHRSLRQVVVT